MQLWPRLSFAFERPHLPWGCKRDLHAVRMSRACTNSMRHQRSACAVLRRSAAGALGTSDRASRAAVQVPLGRLALASFGNPFFFDLLCGRSCESTPKPSRQWRRAGRVSGVEVWAGPPPPLLYYFPLTQLQAVFAMKDLALTTDSPLVAGVRCARSQCRCRVQTPIAVTGGSFK